MQTQSFTETRYLERDTSLPSFIGTAKSEIGRSGAVAELYIGGEKFIVNIDPATGKYAWNATTPMPDGNYSVSLRIIDAAKNASTPMLYTLVVDTTPPDAPQLFNLYDDAGAATGSFDAGTATDDKRPTLTGLAQAGSTVFLRDAAGNNIGSAVADKTTGKWEIEPAQDLKDGTNSLTLVTVENFAGSARTSAPSAAFNIVIGSGSPAVLNMPEPDVQAAAPVAPQAQTQAFTETRYLERSSDLPTISGTVKSEIGRPGGTAEFFIGGEKFVVPLDPATGKYAWTATTPLPDGHYSISVRILDAAKNATAPMLYTLVIDTTPPEAPLLMNLYDDAGSVTGSFDPGKAVDDRRPTLSGVAQKGATVYLRDADGTNIGSAVADKTTGKWVIEPVQDLKDGSNSLTLVAVETFASALREGAPSASFNIVIGSDLPPNTLTINDAFDDAGSVTGSLLSGALTDDTTPTLRGDVSAGNTVTVYWRIAGSTSWVNSATATVTGEKWSWTPGVAFATGEYEFQATTGTNPSNVFTLDIGTADDILRKTRIDAVQDDFGTWQGALTSGAITDDATPTFSGRGEANGKVVVRFSQAGLLPNTIEVDVDSKGDWTWTPSSGLPAGNWSFEVQPKGQSSWSDSFALSITDANGFNPTISQALDNVGAKQDPLHSGDTTDDSTPTLQGRAEANSSVMLRYMLANGTAITDTVKADSAGNWSWTPPALKDGNWTFEVQKPGGSWSEFTLTVDTGPDATISSAYDDVGFVSGYILKGGSTDDNKPLLSGHSKANTLINIYDNNTLIGSTTSDNKGSWSWTPNSALASKLYHFNVANESEGIVGTKSPNWDVNISLKNGSDTFLYDQSYETQNSAVTLPSGLTVTNSRVHIDTDQLILGEGIARITFPEPTNKVRLNLGFGFANNTIRAYDKYGSILGSISHTYTYLGEIPTVTFNHSNISYIEVDTGTLIKNPLPATRGTTWITEMSWGNEPLPSLNAKNINSLSNFEVINDESSLNPYIFTDVSNFGIAVKVNPHFAVSSLALPDITDQIDSIEVIDIDSVIDANKVIDLSDIGDQTITLDIEMLIEKGEKSLFIEDGKTQLVIKGNEGDIVQLVDILPEGSDISEWKHQEGTVTVAGVEYDVYSHGDDAELLVQEGVKTELI